MKNIDVSEIKALVLDIDGTITPEGEKVSPQTIKILSEICITYNLDLIFLTGRAWCLVKYILDEFHNINGDISFVKGVLSELGSKFVNPRGNIVWGKYLSQESKGFILSQIHKDDFFLFSGHDNFYYLYSNDTNIIKKWSNKFSKYGNHIFQLTSKDYHYMTSLFFLDKVSVLRTSAKIENNKTNTSFEGKYNSKHKLWEISQFKSKKNGLIHYCKINNLSVKNILFAGNEVSDLDVFDLELASSIYIGDKDCIKPVDFSLRNPKDFMDLLQKNFPIN